MDENIWSRLYRLLENWRKDPCWDLPDTSGFEDQKDLLQLVEHAYKRGHEDGMKAGRRELAQTIMEAAK